MSKKLIAITLILISLILAGGCGNKADETTQVSEQSVSESSEISSVEPEVEETSEFEKAEFTVQKIAPSQEEVAEEITFILEIPKDMTVTYDWGGEEATIPTVMKDNEWYIQTSSISSYFDEYAVTKAAKEDGGSSENLDILDNRVLLVISPSEKYSTSDPYNKLADGYTYTYYIQFDDGSVLPLTFFSETESDDAKNEFNNIVETFKII